MTIMKTIAVAALAGTLLAGPGAAAFAQSTDHGKSGAAHDNNKTDHDTAKSGNAGGTQGGVNGGGQAGAGDQDTDETTSGDQDTNDDENTTDGQDTSNAGKKLGQPNFGTVVSSLRHADSQTTDLSNLQSGFTVSVVNLGDYAKGNNQVAIDNALGKIDAQAVQDTLSANTDVMAALQAQNIDISTVAYAYVDANGNLVVYTR